MKSRLARLARISAVILLVGCAYSLFFSLTGWGIPCLFHLVTGLNCPGCGVSRMLLSMMRLDFAAAFRYNAVLFCMLPALAALALIWVVSYLRTGTYRPGRVLQITELTMAGILVVWGVVRNLIGM